VAAVGPASYVSRMSHAADLFPFDLGDRRLDRRAARLVQAALDNPGASIPAAAGSPAAAAAAYRFLDNPAVRPEDLDEAHRRYTLGLLAGTDGPVLLAQDTTPLDFTSPARNHSLGQLAHARHFGLFAHSALAVTEGGLPLGLLHQHVWARPPEQRGKRKHRRHKETADKESQRWLDAEAACAAALPPGRTVVTIGDREADFYDYFAVPRRPGQHALVRAKPRRRLAGTKELLGAAVRGGPVRGTLTVEVPRKDGRPGRRAALELRYGTFALRPPSTHPRRKGLPPLPLQAVLAEEADPPAGAEPVRWLLLTTLPVAGAADAARLVRWYTYRWLVERYHFVLKSGCKLEELQLETGARLRRALALYALAAARLLHLTYRARQGPEEPCEPAVSREEWELLWRLFRPGQAPPPAAPPLREALHWVARLGGFLGRKGDGEPGVKVLWRGLRKLHDMVVGARLARAAAQGVQSSDE
jgi:transposase-like protein/transposase Tn5 family protein